MNFEDLKRFIQAFEQLNLFAMDYFYSLLFDAHNEVSASTDGKLEKRKQMETIFETVMERAKLHIAQQEADLAKQLKDSSL